jgi:hypothetical protein
MLCIMLLYGFRAAHEGMQTKLYLALVSIPFMVICLFKSEQNIQILHLRLALLFSFKRPK